MASLSPWIIFVKTYELNKLHLIGLRNQHENTALVKVEGCGSKADSEWYIGKRCAYVYRVSQTPSIRSNKTFSIESLSLHFIRLMIFCHCLYSIWVIWLYKRIKFLNCKIKYVQTNTTGWTVQRLIRKTIVLNNLRSG